MRRFLVVTSSLVLAAAAAAVRPSTSTGAEPAAQAVSGTFRLLRGADTIATERFTRSAGTLRAELSARGRGLTYVVALNPDATVSRIDLTMNAAAGAPPQRSSALFGGDSVVAQVTRGDSTQSEVLQTLPGAIPFLNPSPSLMEQVVRRARVIGGDSASVPVLISGTGRTENVTVRFVGADSAAFALSGIEIRMRVDRAGGVLGGIIPAQNVTILRTSGRR